MRRRVIALLALALLVACDAEDDGAPGPCDPATDWQTCHGGDVTFCADHGAWQLHTDCGSDGTCYESASGPACTCSGAGTWPLCSDD